MRSAVAAAPQPYIIFGKPVIGEPEIEDILDTLRSAWLGSGPKVKTFERQFADYVGARHGVATNSCTAALHLALSALEIGPGDEVVVPTLTFCATANVVVHTGAHPVLVDVDSKTQCVTPQAIA